MSMTPLSIIIINWTQTTLWGTNWLPGPVLGTWRGEWKVNVLPLQELRDSGEEKALCPP